MRRLGVVMASALLALSLFAQGNVARASGWIDNEWCWDDPVVVVLGAQFKVVTGAHTTQTSGLSYTYAFEVPSNAQGRTNVNWPHGLSSTSVQIKYTGAAWNGVGPFSVKTSVTVSGPAGTDVSVSVSGPTVSSASYSGTTNSAVSFSTTVTPGAASDASGASNQ